MHMVSHSVEHAHHAYKGAVTHLACAVATELFVAVVLRPEPLLARGIHEVARPVSLVSPRAPRLHLNRAYNEDDDMVCSSCMSLSMIMLFVCSLSPRPGVRTPSGGRRLPAAPAKHAKDAEGMASASSSPTDELVGELLECCIHAVLHARGASLHLSEHEPSSTLACRLVLLHVGRNREYVCVCVCVCVCLKLFGLNVRGPSSSRSGTC